MKHVPEIRPNIQDPCGNLSQLKWRNCEKKSSRRVSRQYVVYLADIRPNITIVGRQKHWQRSNSNSLLRDFATIDQIQVCSSCMLLKNNAGVGCFADDVNVKVCVPTC